MKKLLTTFILVLIPTILFSQKLFISTSINNIANAGEPILGKQYTMGFSGGIFVASNTAIVFNKNINSFWYGGIRQYVGDKYMFGEILANNTHIAIGGGYSFKLIKGLRIEPRMVYLLPYYRKGYEILNSQIGITYYIN